MTEKRKIVGFGHANVILETLRNNAEDRGYEIHSNPPHFHGWNEWNKAHCRLDSKDVSAEFDVQQMPGCCALLTVSYLHTDKYGDQDQFDTVMQHIENAAFDAAFASVCLTQVVPAYSKMLWKKEPWFKLFDRGYQHVGPFMNAKSGNLVIYLIKDLHQKGKMDGMEVPIYEEIV